MARNVLLISHELSLTGSPLFLIHLAELLSKTCKIYLYSPVGTEQQFQMLLQRCGVSSDTIERIDWTALMCSKSFLQSCKLVLLNTCVAASIGQQLLVHMGSAWIRATVAWWIHEFDQNFLLGTPKKWAIDSAIRVVFESTASRNRWKRALWRNPLQVIPLALPQTFVVAANAHKKEQTISEEVVFVSVGTVCEQKKQLQLVKWFAASVLPSARLLVVGFNVVATAYQSEIKQWCAERELTNRIELIEACVDVHPHYRRADVFLHGNGDENFGLVLLEAMAYSLPIICADGQGGAKEIIENNVTGLFFQPNQLSFTSALAFACNNNVWRTNAGTAGKKRFETMFSEENLLRAINPLMA